MKVLIWCCGFEQRFAGPYVAAEAKRQGFEVRITGSRKHPEQMLAALREYKPDIVFCFALRWGFAPYYRAIKRTGAKLILWYPDMTEKSRDRMWNKSLNNVADVLIFSILETAQRYRNLAPTVLWMPQYFDRRFCSKNGELPARLDSTKPIYDVCFIGSCDKLRSQWLDVLMKEYDCFFARDTIVRQREIRGYEMAEAYAQSKIAINIQRKMFINSGQFITSNRMYNAMGSGAFFINHQVQQLGLAFKEGVHCVTHNDELDNLRAKIDFFLEHEYAREKIALAGQKQVLCYHTLEQRVKEYWQVMRVIHEDRAGDLPVGAFGKWLNS